MSSLFDTEVYHRRNHTPWASVNFLHFVKDMAWHGTDKPVENEVVFRACYRHDVASRIWYELEWTGADGERQSTSSQDFGLLLWRAAEIELKTEARLKRKEEEVGATTLYQKDSGEESHAEA